jgi:penicillin-binding protein 1A
MAYVLNTKKRGFFLSLIYYHFFILLLISIFIGVLSVFIFGFYAKDVPTSPDFTKMKQSASSSTRIFAADGTVIARISGETREWVPLNKIPNHLKQAFIAVEDSRFYEHGAVDFLGLLRAVIVNLKSGAIKQGGSTITQQVAKFYMGGERTVDRKIKEVILALRLEKNLTKDEILELYVNLTFLGKGSFGVKAAARNYFDKTLHELNLGEMALLAGMAQAPTRYSPFRNRPAALKRRKHVLGRMKKRGYISKEEYSSSINSQINLISRRDYYHTRTPYFTEHVRQKLISRVGREGFRKGGYQVETTVRPFVQYTARKAVEELVFWQDKRQGWRGPEKKLKKSEIQKFIDKSKKYYGAGQLNVDKLYLAVVVKSTKKSVTINVAGIRGVIPISKMRWAARFHRHQGITDRHISKVGRKLKPGYVIWVKPTKNSKKVFALEQIPRVQSALYVMDHKSGYVVAMIGGTSFDLTKFNRATQACRQPGSTYKPLYYSLALNKKWSIYKKFSDRPYSIIDPATGKKWRVTNYSYEHGLSEAAKDRIRNHKVTLESALVWSRNIPSVTIFQALGGKKVKKWVKRFGFTTQIIPDKGLALGASCVKMSELNSAFAIFAQNGRSIKRVTIKRIKNSRGEIIEDYTVVEDPLLTSAHRLNRMVNSMGSYQKEAIPPKTAYKMSKLLRKVITNGHNGPIRDARIIVAGKTGTASKTMDTWFSGYTSRWVATFWLGDEKYERPLGDNDAAHLTTAPAFGKFMFDAAKYYPQREIPWEKPKTGESISNSIFNGMSGGKRPKFHPPKKKLSAVPH